MDKTEELKRILERDYSEVDSNYGNPKWSFYRNLRLTSEIVHKLGANNIANIAITYFLTLLTMEKLGKNFGLKSILYEVDYSPIVINILSIIILINGHKDGYNNGNLIWQRTKFKSRVEKTSKSHFHPIALHKVKTNLIKLLK